ncbi:MAG TPA: hypothetical protein VMW24_03750 [Sedimentisphaerales bacterium]|nr:hypothetical protein [Sedimentisphaerales bacterium]
MANNKTNYLEEAVINHVLNKTAYTSPTTYIALFVSATAEEGTGSEVSGASYTRAIVYESGSGSSPKWNAAVDSGGGYLVDNAADITFTTAGEDWGYIVDCAIFDAATTGNMLYYGTLTTPKTVNSGDTIKFVAGALDISEL